MPDIQSILDAHNRLRLLVACALFSTQGPPQFLALKGEAEELLRLVNEVRDHILIFRPGSTNGPMIRLRASQPTKRAQCSKTVRA